MRVRATFERPAGAFRAEVETGSGFRLTMDSGEVEDQSGASPRELVLAGLAGCTGMDVVAILGKKGQVPATYEVAVEADSADAPPRVFTRIVVEHRLSGAVEPEALRRAVELSATRYCPVSRMLSQAVPIEHRYRLSRPGQADLAAVVVSTGPG